MLAIWLPLGSPGCTPDPPVEDEANDDDDGSEGESCSPGTLQCECVGVLCLGDLSCVEGLCVEESCTLGSLGCECLEGACLGSKVCVEGICVEEEEGDGDGDGDSSGDGDGDGDSSGDGDGDSSGDGDGDTTGDGDGDTTGDGDGDTTGDGDGDTTGDGDGDGDGEQNTCAAPNGAFGCQFQGVKLPVHTGVYSDQWALRFVVGNPGPADTTVEVQIRQNGQWVNQAGPLLVPAASFHIFYFYGPADIVPVGRQEGFAYRINSTTPIVVHQYNAGHGATNLLPTNTWGHDYSVVDPGANQNYFVVVAAVDGTTVQIDPTNTVLAGPNVPATALPFQVLMNAGETIGLYTDSSVTQGGSRITSDLNHPIGVFMGSRGANASAHAEEQLLPRSMAATNYIGTTSPGAAPYYTGGSSSYRLFALATTTVDTVSEPNTTISSGFNVNANVATSVSANSNVSPGYGDARFSSTEPIFLFSRSLISGIFPPTTYNMMIAQLIPDQYLATRYGIPVLGNTVQITVAYPLGTTHTFNGQMPFPILPQYEFAPGWRLARYQLEAGMYVLESAVPIAVVIGHNSWALNAGFEP